jgi:hypothetical protein
MSDGDFRVVLIDFACLLSFLCFFVSLGFMSGLGLALEGTVYG